MLTVTRDHKKGRVQLRLAGVIDENVDLGRVMGNLPAQVEICCRDVTQINSLGVKAWIDFFNAATAGGVQLSFVECPPAIVEQLNFISNFACGGAIESVSAPFTCEKCHKELRGLIRTEDVKKAAFRLPSVTCPKCKSQAHFDDVPEEYFSFLMRRPAAKPPVG